MNLGRLINYALDLLDDLRERELIDSSRTGGYLTVVSTEDRPISVPLLVAEVGNLTGEKIVKYHAFSLEKAQRLWWNREDDHVSSWQSRDPDNNLWGGAIRAGDYILSFSGLPELADEALMLALALEWALLSREQADRIADISNNDIFRRLVVS